MKKPLFLTEFLIKAQLIDLTLRKHPQLIIQSIQYQDPKVYALQIIIINLILMMTFEQIKRNKLFHQIRISTKTKII